VLVTFLRGQRPDQQLIPLDIGEAAVHLQDHQWDVVVAGHAATRCELPDRRLVPGSEL
jgi:hypothetical protein